MASVTPQEVDACVAAGIDASVMKPVELSELFTAIDEVLRRPMTTNASLARAG